MLKSKGIRVVLDVMKSPQDTPRKEDLDAFLKRVGGHPIAPAENDFYFVNLPYFGKRFIPVKVKTDTTFFPSTAEAFIYEQREADPDIQEDTPTQINKYHLK